METHLEDRPLTSPSTPDVPVSVSAAADDDVTQDSEWADPDLPAAGVVADSPSAVEQVPDEPPTPDTAPSVPQAISQPTSRPCKYPLRSHSRRTS